MTPKQQKFVEEYLIDLNATKAAMRAGYSKKTAHRIGAENMQKPAIKKAINEARKKFSQKTEVTTEKIIKGFSDIAFSDSEMTEDRDKVASLNSLARIMGMFNDKLSVKHSGLTDSRVNDIKLKILGIDSNE
jgi:phage terminase small subunit